MHKAVDEMGAAETFRGYGPEQGYDFLREAIAAHDFATRGVDIQPDEIFISDGAKSDCGNIGDLFDVDNKVALCDPVYTVYLDTNAMSGRAGEYDAETGRWSNIYYMPTTAENDFVPALPEGKVDIIYLCSPNNPTGTVLTKDQLKVWVDYANANDAIILFDAAYESFIVEDNTVVPKELVREGASLNAMWNRRQTTKFNGTAYIIQRGAEAVYSEAGQKQVKENIAYYQKNAKAIKEGLSKAGLEVYGAVNSPYVWAKTPNGMGSWEFFDLLLEQANVVTTPGAGFGPSGEGYIRMTAFGDADQTVEAVARVAALLKK